METSGMVKKTFIVNGEVFLIMLKSKGRENYQATITNVHGTKSIDVELISSDCQKSIVTRINKKDCFQAKVSQLSGGNFLVNLLYQATNFLVQEVITPTSNTPILPARIIQEKTYDTACILKSPLGGRIIRVNVKEGDWVKENQTLFIIESMKMENEICAPFNARVKTLSILPGNVVQTSQVLITFEKKGEGDAITKDEDQQKEISHR